jgi:hypothetical protein
VIDQHDLVAGVLEATARSDAAKDAANAAAATSVVNAFILILLLSSSARPTYPAYLFVGNADAASARYDVLIIAALSQRGARCGTKLDPVRSQCRDRCRQRLLGRNGTGTKNRPPTVFSALFALCSAIDRSAINNLPAIVRDQNRMDPAWMLRSLAYRNPLVWMAQVNGLLFDLHDMPREVQEIAFAKGMIPYIPADQE